jgi:hypothetical protein
MTHFNGLSIFDYKLKSTSESNVNGQWTEDKSVNNQVTFISGKYKVKQYNITYDVNYSASDGNKKESDVTLITQEQTHGKNYYDVMDINGIN